MQDLTGSKNVKQGSIGGIWFEHWMSQFWDTTSFKTFSFAGAISDMDKTQISLIQ